jgi:hypothetical protein
VIGGECFGEALVTAELLGLVAELGEVGCRILGSRRPCARGEEQKRDDGKGEAFDDWRRRSCPREVRKPLGRKSKAGARGSDAKPHVGQVLGRMATGAGGGRRVIRGRRVRFAAGTSGEGPVAAAGVE